MSRALSPVVGGVLLTAVNVIASVPVGAATLSHAPPDPAPRVAVDATAAPDGRVTLVHRGVDAVSVADLRVHATRDGEPLRHQPPVPFVGAPGFRGAPTGPFNRAGEGRGRPARKRRSPTPPPPGRRSITGRRSVSGSSRTGRRSPR